ncbi:MAG: serine hydroxymethyltransferase [Verrucomicrobiota bacterium]
MICHGGSIAVTSVRVQGSRPEAGEKADLVGFFGGNVAIEGYIFQMSVVEHTAPSLAETDPQIASLINQEQKRQGQNIELIASENFTSRAVMEAQGSCLTNKYAEGYPAKRWYGGCEFVDEIETLAIDRAKELFEADHANVQPHSGSSANMAVYYSVLKPGDKILTMDLSHGGHLTHGHPMNFSGQLYDVKHYGVEKETGMIDYDKLAASAEEFQPKMITVGASAYSRIINFERMGEIAKSVGAYLFADIAHIAGLVAAGEHPSPVPFADFVTTTTHKTLRGPRSGLILCKEEHAKGVDSLVFPGCQGGPLVHVIAAKAVCFLEALQPEFKSYQSQVRKNAKALCAGMKSNGYDIISGDTENHVMLVDLQPKGINGKESQIALDHAGITVNKNAVPFDEQSPFKAGGIRLGSPAATTRGMLEPEMARIANWIHEGIEQREDPDALSAIRDEVYSFTANYPLPY